MLEEARKLVRDRQGTGLLHIASVERGGALAKSILIEQYHVDVFIPPGLSDTESRVIRRTLDSRRLHVRIERAVRAVLGKYRSLRSVRIALTK